MDGQVAIIAGASGDVGRVTARMLAKNGTRLVLQYRTNRAPLDELLAEFDSGQVALIQADLTEPEACDQLAEQAWQTFGRVDAFVNTVGFTRHYERLSAMSTEAIDRTIDVELRSIVYSVRAVLPKMIETGYGGRIVLVGSDSGKVGTTGEAISAACRAAIIGFAKSVAREHARDGILTNVVCPGPIETALWDEATGEGYSGSVAGKILAATPLRRPARPSEIANLIEFLAGERASFITGQAISVSGGLTMTS